MFCSCLGLANGRIEKRHGPASGGLSRLTKIAHKLLLLGIEVSRNSCPRAVSKKSAQIRTVPVPLRKANTAARLALPQEVAKRTYHLRRDADAITGSVWPHAQHNSEPRPSGAP